MSDTLKVGQHGLPEVGPLINFLGRQLVGPRCFVSTCPSRIGGDAPLAGGTNAEWHVHRMGKFHPALSSMQLS